MANIQIKSDKVTPFGGIFQFSSLHTSLPAFSWQPLRRCRNFLMKKGVKELGYQTEFSPMYDLKLVKKLIEMEPPETAIFLNFNKYSKACAYYYLHQFGLPVADKFIV